MKARLEKRGTKSDPAVLVGEDRKAYKIGVHGVEGCTACKIVAVVATVYRDRKSFKWCAYCYEVTPLVAA